MKQPRSEKGDAESAPPLLDRTVALELSAEAASKNGSGFASGVAAAIASAYHRNLAGARNPTHLIPPPAPDGVVLDREAAEIAARIAAGIGTSAPAEAAYIIGSIYTGLLPTQFRARHGIFYTPPEMVEVLLRMADEAGTDWRTARVLDPACGGGAFLIGAALRMAHALESAEPAIALQNIAARLSGFDLDPFGAWLAQAMLAIALEPLADAAGQSVPKIVETRDSLDLDSVEAESLDLVIGNPPYGRVTLSPERRQRFARSVYGHANLYGVFTDAAVGWVKPGGVIGYVTPTSMLSGLYYKSLRRLLAAEAPPLSVKIVSEREGVFADVLQETMLATYRKGGAPVPANVGLIGVRPDRTVVSRKAGRFTLPTASQSPWLLPRTAEQEGLTKRLRSMPHRLADYGYRVSTGPLVWNRHKEQFCRKQEIGAIPVVWAEAITSDGRFLWRSEKRNHLPWFAARRGKDDWLIVTQPCVLVQRTTAKEQARRLIAAEMTANFIRGYGGVTVENHLNMVRAVEADPSVPTAAIAALLNSAAVDAAFRCLNGSVAVSAFELEEMPLPPPAVMATLAVLVAAAAPPAKIASLIAAAYGWRDAAAAA